MTEEMKRALQDALDREDLWTMRKIIARSGPSHQTPPDDGPQDQ